MSKKNLEKHANNIRREILKMAYEMKSSHTGGSLSCVDFLTALYFSFLKINPKIPYDPERDRVVFSKAHDSKALYATLAQRGYFDKKILSSYERDGGLPGHTTRHIVPGIETSNGSLGHGLSVATGMAFAGKINKKSFRVFAILSDGECDEGSTWEAIHFAGHHKLSNLTAIVDYNKLQSFGRTKDVLDLDPFGDKWKAFRWSVKEVDGHNIADIVKVLKNIPFSKTKPSVIIAHTIKGYKGVPKYVNEVSSQYKPPNEEEYKKALEGLK